MDLRTSSFWKCLGIRFRSFHLANLIQSFSWLSNRDNPFFSSGQFWYCNLYFLAFVIAIVIAKIYDYNGIFFIIHGWLTFCIFILFGRNYTIPFFTIHNCKTVIVSNCIFKNFISSKGPKIILRLPISSDILKFLPYRPPINSLNIYG